MRDHQWISGVKYLLVVLVLLLATTPALAYVGPGAGLEFVGYFSTLIAMVVTACSTLLMWPFYALVRHLRSWISQHTPSVAKDR